MRLVLMSTREIQKIEGPAQVLNGQPEVGHGARVPDLSQRQVSRLLHAPEMNRWSY